jgi:hypothetical protein
LTWERHGPAVCLPIVPFPPVCPPPPPPDPQQWCHWALHTHGVHPPVPPPPRITVLGVWFAPSTGCHAGRVTLGAGEGRGRAKALSPPSLDAARAGAHCVATASPPSPATPNPGLPS